MATSSVPAAIDWLVATASALPETEGVIVSDGFTPRRGDQFLLIGIEDEDTETEGVLGWAALRSRSPAETYDIPCLISCFAPASADAKTARDAAFTIFNALWSAVLADKTLGGALHGGTASVAGLRLMQTNDPEEAGSGRRASIYFTVRVEAWS